MNGISSKFWADSDPFDDDSSISETESSKRPLEDAFDEEDAPQSTPATPTKKVQQLIDGVRTWRTDRPLASPQKKIVKEAMTGAQGAPDTPRRKKQATLAEAVVKEGLARITDETPFDPESPGYHNRVLRCLESSGGWTIGVIGDAAKIARNAVHGVRLTGQFVNLPHITGINSHENKISGCHWLAPDDETRKQVQITAYNVATGVRVGFIHPQKLADEEGKPAMAKFSSFFPDSIKTEAELIQLIQDAPIVCECDNVQIRKADNLYFTCYIRTNELEIRSAFPHFIHEVWRANHRYTITPNCTISSQEVIDAFKQIKNQKPSPVHMVLDDDVVIDIAPGLPTKDTIPKGIYFIVPIRLLHRL